MKTKLVFKQVLIFSEKNNKYFFSEFKDKLNVIYGKNTAGKSTLIQLMLYCFGINDKKIKLKEILSEDIFIRIDCSLIKNEQSENYIFIRQNETLKISDGTKLYKFNGIAADNSSERVKLKNLYEELFNFKLKLESNSGISKAPIETLFLPYYISQDVGWVYLRKSFTNLNFYKNFKEDFLDYYLGIESVEDRTEKRSIEKELKSLNYQMNLFNKIESEDANFKISKVLDSAYQGEISEIIERINKLKSNLTKNEKEYILKCNDLTFLEQRKSVVNKVKRNHKNQTPGEDPCPTCNQILPVNIGEIYNFNQENNDNEKLTGELKRKIVTVQSKINSIQNKIQSIRLEIKEQYELFNTYSKGNLTLDDWISNKANLKLYSKLEVQKSEVQKNIDELRQRLQNYQTENEILTNRERKNREFKKYLIYNNNQLSVPNTDEDRFSKIYKISTLPFQGVELHLAILSYHFAFNRILKETENIHRLPFIMDSIFKEDIEAGSKDVILKFINNNFPKDTQTILSIADDKNNESKIQQYKDTIFKDNAHLICIGDGVRKKSLLENYDSSLEPLLKETFEIIDKV